MDKRMLREMRRSGSADGTATYTPGPLHPHDALEERLERVTRYAKELEKFYVDEWTGIYDTEDEVLAGLRSEHGITDADMEVE